MLTANDAAATIRSQNRRNVPPISPTMRKLAEERKVCVFNIYTVSWTKSLGSLGRFIIPACNDNGSQRPADWAPFSEPLVIPGFIFEPFDTGTKHMGMAQWDGSEVAKDVVGISDGIPSNSLERWGVFIAAGATPTKEELALAKQRLNKTMAEALAEGDRMWRGNENERKLVGDYHKRAAVYLNVKREWDSTPTEQHDCKFCGEPIKPNLIVCPHCKQVLDQKRWLEAQPDYILKQATQTNPVKPPVSNR